MNRLPFVLGMVGVLSLLSVSLAVAEEVTADDYMQMWKPLVGQWKTTNESEGETVEGTWLFRQSKTKKCFVSYGEGGVFPASEGIHGYCPAKKKWTIVSFDAEGGVKFDEITVIDMHKGKKLDVGLTSKWKTERVRADGTKTTGSVTMACKELSPDRMVFSLQDIMEDGEPQPDAEWISERMKRAKRKKDTKK